nr:MAG TPA: hypothetical protein [Caudoviricetes sp.]
MHAEEALTYPGSAPPNILINDQVVFVVSLPLCYDCRIIY